MKRICFILFFFTIISTMWAQHRTQCFDPNIRTLRIQMADRATLSRPYLVLHQGESIDGSDESNALEISFDEMSHDVHQYSYCIKHLNADWKESDMQSFEYLNGFTTEDITDYVRSLNTQRAYTHYSFFFPHEDMQICASGNYVIEIYEDGDKEKIIAEACFSVVEPLAEIAGAVRSQTDIELNGRFQQLELQVRVQESLRSQVSANIGEELFIVVNQNNRRDNEVYHPKANYIGNGELKWQNNKQLIFEGGNEYHHFDAYSRYYAGVNIDRIAYDHNDYHVLLEPDMNRGVGGIQGGAKTYDKTGVNYMHEYDSNGQFIINAERTDDADSEGEYMWVHWFLKMDEPLWDGIVYIGGDAFYNQMTSANRMTYDYEAGGYMLSALLKQGGYDYQYWLKRKGEKAATLQMTEGSHWETGNEYCVRVYFRPFGARADRLIGLQTF